MAKLVICIVRTNNIYIYVWPQAFHSLFSQPIVNLLHIAITNWWGSHSRNLFSVSANVRQHFSRKHQTDSTK